MGFDLNAARIVNAPDVRGWSETARITEVSFDGATTRVKHTGEDRWPDVTPPGWDGPLQYTIWLFLQLDAWVGSAFIQMWRGRDGSGSLRDPDVPSVFHNHWFYGTRWAPMQEHGPIRRGEAIAFMVTSGNQRDSVGPHGPQERSNIVVVEASDFALYRFDDVAPPPPGPPLPPIDYPDPDDLGARVARLEAKMAAIEGGLRTAVGGLR